MKHFLSILFFIIAACSTHAQVNSNNLPDTSMVSPYTLEVGYYYNTAIAFPGTIKKAYWGYKDIMAMEVPQVENILLVKAARKNFDPTNLHVITFDGKLYVFNITYKDNPAHTTFDLRNLNPLSLRSVNGIGFSGQPLNEVQMNQFVHTAKTSKSFLSKATQDYEMKLRLKGIYYFDDLLFFSFSLSNYSNLTYDIDFTNLYIQDRYKSSHSSYQQRQLAPIKVDALRSLPGQTTNDFVVVVQKFTIPDRKEFLFELYERNGGRNLSLRIKNRQLLKAKPL